MAYLVKCSLCGRDVSSEAKACPGCGHDVAGDTRKKEALEAEKHAEEVKKKIVGKWQQDDLDAWYCIFEADGSFHNFLDGMGGIDSNHGQYYVKKNGEIEISYKHGYMYYHMKNDKLYGPSSRNDAHTKVYK
jgi:DNA-directed RNA polymerase subunit RPC12/RpoP